MIQTTGVKNCLCFAQESS